MKNKFSLIIILILLSLVFTACSAEYNSNENNPSQEGAITQTHSEGITSELPENDKPTDSSESSKYDDLEIITLLPPDAIPAIDNPAFLSTAEADSEYAPEELVIGVEFNGEARAYSIPFLSSHEIVNDTVGGIKLSVTW